MNYFLAMTLLMGLAQSFQSQNNQSKPNKMNSANQKNHRFIQELIAVKWY